MSQYAHVNTYMHIIFYKSYTHFTLHCISYSIYPLYSTNCADEFHTLRCRVVRCTYTIILCAQSKKMGDSCAFDIQCYKFPLYLHHCVKRRTFRFEKAASKQWKIYIMKKAIMLHSCMLCRLVNLLNNKQ